LNIAKIIAELKAERRKLDAAIRVLEDLTLKPVVKRRAARRRPAEKKRVAPPSRVDTKAQPMGKLLEFSKRGRRWPEPRETGKAVSEEGTSA